MEKDNVTFRYAEPKDVPLVLHFIKELADYEKMSDEVIATEETLRETLMEKKQAEVIFLVSNGKEVGFALFFQNYSTFLGKSGLYLEDLFVQEGSRKKGYGKLLIKQLAKIAVERNCGRFEWCCLDWNQPSIDFYLSLGAEAMDEWTTYRVTGENLRKLSE